MTPLELLEYLAALGFGLGAFLALAIVGFFGIIVLAVWRLDFLDSL